MSSGADDKYNKPSASDGTDRRWKFSALLVTLLLDVYSSEGKVLEHLTLWSWILHTIYFGLPMSSSDKIIPWIHGPSLSGSFALFAMYVWTLIANPSMEFDLAPEGRSDVMVYARAAWLHAGPVMLHYMDTKNHALVLRRAYQPQKSMFLSFWTSVGGYFAMGLTWEACFEGAVAGTYNVTRVPEAVYINVSKGLGVVACLFAFSKIIKPKFLS